LAATASSGATSLATLHHFETVVVETVDHDGDVGGALVDLAGAATCTGGETLEGGTLVGVARLHVQLFGIGDVGTAVGVGGVGHRAGEHLANQVRGLTVGELQHFVGVAHRKATDVVEDDAHLAGRGAHILGAGLGAAALAGDERALVELRTGHLRPFEFFS